MTTAYETLSKEEANAFFFGGQPQMAPQQMAPQQAASQQSVPVETAPRKTKPIAPPVMGKPIVGELDPQGLVAQVNQANKAIQAQTPAPQAPSVVGALMDQILGNWALPALGLGALAAAGYGGYKSGASTKEGLKSRDISKRIEPTMDGLDLSKPTPTAVPYPTEEPKTKFAVEFETKYGVPLTKAEEISGGKITKQWEADIVGNAIKNQLPITVKKEAPIKVEPSDWAKTGIVATSSNNSFPTTPPATMAVAPTAQTDPFASRPNPYMTPAATTPSVSPVVPAEKPVSKVKKPVDPTEAGLTKQEIGMKRYLESFYGGGEVGAKTYGQVGEILGYRPAFEPGKGGGLKAEENAVIKSYRKENIEGPKVNLDKEMKRGLKGGLAVGALMAIPGFADAAQKKDYGRMVDLASDFIVPPFAGSTELGVSTLGEKQMKAFENAQKLGSPYRSVPPR
jgi:hypothetical protein